MTALQQFLDIPNSDFVLMFLNHSSEIAAGTTVGSFLLCLQPWASSLSTLTDRDVGAYINELRKPSDKANAFDRVEIRELTNVTRAMVHEPIPDDVDFAEWLNRDREIVWDDKWRIESDYTITGCCNDDPTNWSSSVGIHELKNVPLVINRSALLIYRNNDGSPLINKVPQSFMISDATYGVYVDNDDSRTTWKDLIEVVICDCLWHSKPTGADNLSALLAAASAELDQFEATGEEPQPPSLRLVDDSDTEDDPQSESTKVTVSIAPGAFTGVAESINQEMNEWDQVVDVISASNVSAIMIGKVQEESPADNRAYGCFLE